MSYADLEDTRDDGRAVGACERVWSGPIFTVDDEEVVLAEGHEPVRCRRSSTSPSGWRAWIRAMWCG